MPVINQMFKSGKLLFIITIVTMFAICAVISQTNLTANAEVAAPVVTGAETASDGSKVIITFNKALTALAQSPAGFAVTVNSSVYENITSAALSTNDACKVELTLANPVTSSDTTVTSSYTPGTVSATDGGVLAGFSNYPVINKVLEPLVNTDTRVSAYLTVINSDNTSTTGEAITSDLQVPLKPVIKLKFLNNVTYNAAQNITCVNLRDSSGQAVPNVDVFTLGTGAGTDPEKNNIFVKPDSPLALGATYKIVISPEVLFKNGLKLGEPAVEITFTTVASAAKVTLAGAVLSGQTLTLTGLPTEAELEYRIVTGSTSGEWTVLTYTGTTATINASALAITSGVSQVEVRVKEDQSTTACKTVFLAVDGNKQTMINGETLSFEDNVSVAAQNLDPSATNIVGVERYTLPAEWKFKFLVGYAYKFYIQGSGENRKVTLSFPVDPTLDINKMSAYLVYKCTDETGEPGIRQLEFLTPDRSRAADHIISVDAIEVPETGGTYIYQVFIDDNNPGPVAFTATPIVDCANHTITFPQIQYSDMDMVARVEMYRDGNLIGLVNGDTYTDYDPNFEVGQTYSYNMKAYDRMGNWSWCCGCGPGPDVPDPSYPRLVIFMDDEIQFAQIRQQIADGTIPIIYADGDSAANARTDFQLPKTVDWAPDARISWTIDNLDPTTGDVKSADGSDKELTLTATVKIGERVDPNTVSLKVRTTWEPWEGGIMPVHLGFNTDTQIADFSIFYRALEQENIKTIIILDPLRLEELPNYTLDCKGKTLVNCSFNSVNLGDGINALIKNAVIEVKEPIVSNGPDDSFIALAQSRSGFNFENVVFKGGENVDCFILSHGGSLVLNNCSFDATRIAPVIIEQGNAVNEPTGIRIENCTFDGAGKPGYAIYYDKIGSLTAYNNTITGFQGTTSFSGPSAGFLITPGRTATLIGNKISNSDDGIIVQTRTTLNTTINDITINDTATAIAAGNALLESNELTAGSGPVVAVNNVDAILHPVIWFQAATDELSTVYGAPTWSADKTLTASDIGETELTLTWSGVDPVGVTGYRVYQGADLIATVSDTTYHITGLMHESTYHFRVEAGNAQAKWSFDGPTTTAVTTQNTLPTWPEGSKITVTEVGPNSAIVSWTPAMDKVGVHWYYLYLNGEGYGGYDPHGSLSAGIKGLEPDTEYTVQVYAEDDKADAQTHREGVFGPSVTFKTTPGTPTKWILGKNWLVASNIQDTSFTLNFKQAGWSQYKLFSNEIEMAVFPGLTDTGEISSYDVTGLEPGTTYTFKLEAFDGENWTTDGPSITVTTLAQGSHSGEIGCPVDIYLQGSTGWLNSINGVRVAEYPYYGYKSTSVFDQCTVTPGHIHIGAGAFTEAKNYTIRISSTGYPDVYIVQTMVQSSGDSPVIEPVITPVYQVIPTVDTAYTVGATQDGINTMTVNPGTNGFKYFIINITPQQTNAGEETAVFVHLRNGIQIGKNATKADFDNINTAKAGFNVQAGDVVKVYVVDDLTNAVDTNPIIFQ